MNTRPHFRVIFSILLLLVISATARAGSYTYGNSADLGAASDNAPGFLLGSEIAVPTGMILQDAGIIFRTTGYNAQVGIYTDNGGAPDTLVADTGVFAVNTIGSVLIPVGSVTLAPGNYWFMAIYDATASVGYSAADPSAPVAYTGMTFGSGLPSSLAGATNSYTGDTFNYFLTGVPEPTTLSLLALAIPAVLVRRSRRMAVAA